MRLVKMVRVLIDFGVWEVPSDVHMIKSVFYIDSGRGKQIFDCIQCLGLLEFDVNNWDERFGCCVGPMTSARLSTDPEIPYHLWVFEVLNVKTFIPHSNERRDWVCGRQISPQGTFQFDVGFLFIIGWSVTDVLHWFIGLGAGFNVGPWSAPSLDFASSTGQQNGTLSNLCSSYQTELIWVWRTQSKLEQSSNI